MTSEQQDKLFTASCIVSASVAKLDSAIDAYPTAADVGRGYSVALNVLIDNCRMLKGVVDSICPVEPREGAK